MRNNPFQDLTRKARWRARLARWRRNLVRPLRPDRIDPQRRGAPNLLLLGIDTLRSDHLGRGGYGADTSPQLDRLSDAGTTFVDVTAPAPWTLPSFAGALTGVMPGLHGAYLSGAVRDMENQPPGRLDPAVPTLATRLRQRGYRTAAFYSNQFFGFGLAESFEHHEYHNLAAGDLADLALDWIRRHADEPFFCFVLFNDPHEPTTPAPEDLEPFLRRAEARGAATDGHSLRSYVRWGDQEVRSLGLPVDAASTPDERRVREQALALKLALYDAAIHEVDRTIGRMQEQLDGWELAPRTLVSVFSDHGEEFTEHSAFSQAWHHDPRGIHGIGHGHTLFQELLHVPWLAWGPGVAAGRLRRDPVSLCDLAPTLLDWLGLDRPGGSVGRRGGIRAARAFGRRGTAGRGRRGAAPAAGRSDRLRSRPGGPAPRPLEVPRASRRPATGAVPPLGRSGRAERRGGRPSRTGRGIPGTAGSLARHRLRRRWEEKRRRPAQRGAQELGRSG